MMMTVGWFMALLYPPYLVELLKQPVLLGAPGSRTWQGKAADGNPQYAKGLRARMSVTRQQVLDEPPIDGRCLAQVDKSACPVV